MTNDIRPYGPGKFDTIVDSYVHASSLDGCDEECGDVIESGAWYGLLRGPLLESVLDVLKDKLPATYDPAEALTDDETALLRDAVGCIVSEDSQGFVSVEYFDTSDELEAAWHSIATGDNVSDDGPHGPQDEDVTANDPDGPFHYCGKIVARTRDELRAWMARESYWPSVWFISDHGNAHLLADI